MRRPWLACLLSVLFPGLGQLYAGEPVRGVMALLWVVVLLPPAMNALLVPMSESPASVLGAIAIMTILYLLVALDAWGRARLHRERPARPWQRWWVYLLFVTGGMGVNWAAETWIPPTLWYQQFRLPSNGMRPTLLRGDRVVGEMHGIDLQRLQRGDVIFFRPPGKDDTVYVKRVIGLPGDSVEIREGLVKLNADVATCPGEEASPETGTMQTPALRAVETVEGRSWEVLTFAGMQPFGPSTVPDGHVFVLGDLRFASRDSRDYGPIREADVRGRLIRVWWSTEPPASINETPPLFPDIRWERIGTRPWVEAKEGCPGE